MDDSLDRDEHRQSVRPLFLYPILGLMALGLACATLIALRAGDWQHLGFLAGLACMGYFLYRNPAIVNGPAWGAVDEFAEAEAMEYMWLGQALVFASLVVF